MKSVFSPQTLDKVEMEMSTCDEPRPPNGPSPIATASGQRWAFVQKDFKKMCNYGKTELVRRLKTEDAMQRGTSC